MFYHRRLSKYKYKPSVFHNIVEFSHSAKWKSGFDSNGMFWSVEELELDYKKFPVLHEIFDSLNLSFKRPSFFLSKIFPGGLPNHIDHRKWGNLGLPLVGDFQGSKINFHDQFNQIIEVLDFNTPTKNLSEPFIINTRATHSVVHSKESQKERITLMLNLFEWPGTIFEKVDEDKIFTKTPSCFL